MKTIFDLGMHRGEDTQFYLAKGFRVVALEANPTLCDPDHWVGADEIARRIAVWRTLSCGNVSRLKRAMLKAYGKITRKTWLIHRGRADIHARLDA